MKRLHSALALAGLLAACGRSQLYAPHGSGGTNGQAGGPEEPDECAVDSDCASTDPCLRAVCTKDGARLTCQSVLVTCDDGDPCSVDSCDSSAGGCVHQRPVDADHDGFVGKAPAGVPASCGGDDCDDTDPNVHPGAAESCDGKDDDCNGNVDDGAAYSPVGAPVRIAPTLATSEVVGFAFDGSTYGVTHNYRSPGSRNLSYFETLAANGQTFAGPTRVSDINADTFAGALDFSGKSYLTAWNDARQGGSYEIYFTRFDTQAQKLSADVRLTNAPGFSLKPVVRFTGSEYVVIWEDQRFLSSGQGTAIFARRVSEKGEILGEEVRLTTEDEDADSVSFDVSGGRLGVAYVVAGLPTPDGRDSATMVRFRSFDLTLADGTGPFAIGGSGQSPSVAGTSSGFVVAWNTGSEQRGWDGAIQAASLNQRGSVLAAESVTSGDTHARDRALVSFGDRVLLVWSAKPTDGDPFELWYELVDAQKLGVISPRALLAKSATGDQLINPHAARGANGDVGVAYDENGPTLSYFVRLGCGGRAPGPNPR